jgi:hypothetical protein
LEDRSTKEGEAWLHKRRLGRQAQGWRFLLRQRRTGHWTWEGDELRPRPRLHLHFHLVDLLRVEDLHGKLQTMTKGDQLGNYLREERRIAEGFRNFEREAGLGIGVKEDQPEAWT